MLLADKLATSLCLKIKEVILQANKHNLLHLHHHLSIFCFFICCGAVPGTQPEDWLQLRNALQAAPTAIVLPCCLQLCNPLTGD